MSSATLPSPGAGAVVVSRLQASDSLRFGMFAIMVRCACFSRGRVKRCVSSNTWNVVRAPSRASGAVASDTALPSPPTRMMRSRPMSKSSTSGEYCRITRSAP